MAAHLADVLRVQEGGQGEMQPEIYLPNRPPKPGLTNEQPPPSSSSAHEADLHYPQPSGYRHLAPVEVSKMAP